MPLDLSTVKTRDSLPSRREPYWQRIRPGCFVGYRPSAREGPGTWIARAYDEDRNAYRLKSLGSFAELPSRDRFVVAKEQAEAFTDLVETGGYTENRPETVEEACRLYAATSTAVQIGTRFERYVYSDPLAKVKLDRLRRHHLLAWRKRLAERPALVSRNKVGPPKTRPRAPSTVNREMAALRAALNKVLAPGTPNTEAAWQEGLRAIRNADRQRTLYLDREQRQSLLANLCEEAYPFVRALCLLPLRPGAVAHLCVQDFDTRTSELSIGKDKSGRPRRILLPPAAAELFANAVKDRPADERIFLRANGKPWECVYWRGPIAEAVAKAGLPAGATAYTLRHSTITDLVIARLPLLTVAQISDTSVEMIERHYGHLDREAAVEALAGLEL